MANNFTNRPHVIDTTGALGYKGGTIRKMIWTSVTGSLIAATDQLIVAHGDASGGTPIWQVAVPSDPGQIENPFDQEGFPFQGDIHVTIPHGRLFIYLV